MARYVRTVMRTFPLALCLLLAATACSPEGSTSAAPTAAPSATASAAAVPQALATPGEDAPVPNAERQQPLTALGPCKGVPDSGVVADVKGLVVPEGAVLTRVTPADPLTNVQGYVPMTPVQLRAYYQQHPDLTIVSVEDEVHEAEVLHEADGVRVFVKAQAVCELGSMFVAVVSPVSP